MSSKILSGAALLAAILSTPVTAGEIAFDFTGVVQRRSIYDHGTFTEDLSGAGQSFSARMVIDTFSHVEAAEKANINLFSNY